MPWKFRAPKRAAYLDGACNGNTQLRAEVESLLASHDEAGTFIEPPAPAAPKLTRPLPDSLGVGAGLGPYRIVQLIAEGGMGAVYQAVRVDDLYRKVVAIKVIRRGVFGDYALKRFDTERQILMMMGFSAGGHLAALVAVTQPAPAGGVADAIDQTSCRPDLPILGYPVISMLEHCNVVTRRNLLGDDPPPDLLDKLSADRHAPPDTPPTFLFHTGEDAAVTADHSLAFYAALRRVGIPAEMHVDPVRSAWHRAGCW